MWDKGVDFPRADGGKLNPWVQVAASVAISDAVFEVPTASSRDEVPAVVTLLSGASAGVVSRTCTAPFDRMKVIMQAGGLGQSTGTLTGMRDLIKSQGLRSMWNGALSSVPPPTSTPARTRTLTAKCGP